MQPHHFLLNICILVILFRDILATSNDRNRTSKSRSSSIETSTTVDKKFKCFVCPWSLNVGPCGDSQFSLVRGQPTFYMVNCLACYKQVFHTPNAEKEKVLRGCSHHRPYYAVSCQKLFNQDGSYIETCACESEYCNGSTKQLPLHFNLISLLGMWFILRQNY